MVATEDGLEVKSRRGWAMAERLPELAGLPTGLVLDGELITFGFDGRPSFPLLCQRVLHSRTEIPTVLMIFDILRVEGADTMCLAYAERRVLLEALELCGAAWQTPTVFNNGEALLEATGAQGLEGIVAKRRGERYRPGERGWVKVKHRHYWRFGQELELVRSGRRRSAAAEMEPSVWQSRRPRRTLARRR
jgi:bifunctional non-homologous end joining protein LigD